MSELVRFGRATIDISKLFAFYEEDDGRVVALSDRAAEACLTGSEAARFLKYIQPRVLEAMEVEETMAGAREEQPASIQMGDVTRKAP